MTQTLYPLWKYGRFFFGTVIVTVAIPLFIIGGQPIKWFAIAVGVAALVTELLSGRYEDEPSYKYPELFYFLQYYSQIAGIVLTILWAWMLAMPEKDLLGIGAAVQALTGYDAIAAHMANDTWGVYAAALILTGIAGALGSIAIGHELTHRTERPFAVFMGRWARPSRCSPTSRSAIPMAITIWSARRPIPPRPSAARTSITS